MKCLLLATVLGLAAAPAANAFGIFGGQCGPDTTNFSAGSVVWHVADRPLHYTAQPNFSFIEYTKFTFTIPAGGDNRCVIATFTAQIEIPTPGDGISVRAEIQGTAFNPYLYPREVLLAVNGGETPSLQGSRTVQFIMPPIPPGTYSFLMQWRSPAGTGPINILNTTTTLAY
jgi:hypothetical protein